MVKQDWLQWLDHAEWIAIRNREPYWRTKRRIKEKWRIKDLDKRAKLESRLGETEHVDKDKNYSGGIEPSNDILESWVILSKMGYGFRGAGVDENSAKRYDDSEDFYLDAEEERLPLYGFSTDFVALEKICPSNGTSFHKL